ncbi:Oidioi.mRNA.OKI2018_I69.XSR.g14145.t1.cds [Oikopleura dioica]|uniref:Oidioi.mRNA.OKI2018_I69.XSR.g14145.t1.cds n=1 Tax=Oikopleura dioica TaxID=34765 RepID=A0ABN7SD03_OIKDI|nr:Oidioi.mRNA.OKI2018_I69.XSR.g14145.t1.cds [Oikopleura dioica]
MWIECLFITTGVLGKFFGSGDQLRDYESDDEDLAKLREEQVFALFYEGEEKDVSSPNPLNSAPALSTTTKPSILSQPFPGKERIAQPEQMDDLLKKGRAL